jgi:hypothetical protein
VPDALDLGPVLAGRTGRGGFLLGQHGQDPLAAVGEHVAEYVALADEVPLEGAVACAAPRATSAIPALW